ncbi:hypothetical protein M9Y10_006474 [Tritrichomonas musculus]
MIIILSLHNFSQFADESDDFQIVKNYRTDLSKELFTLVESQNNFSYIRESSDQFIYAINREQTAISVWKILEASASFSKDMMKIVNKMNEKYDASIIEPKIMLFKCKEPNWYATKDKTATIDWENDIMLNAQIFSMYGRLNTINYSTQKKEMKAPNTTLLKAQKTPNGDPFDMFVVV